MIDAPELALLLRNYIRLLDVEIESLKSALPVGDKTINGITGLRRLMHEDAKSLHEYQNFPGEGDRDR